MLPHRLRRQRVAEQAEEVVALIVRSQTLKRNAQPIDEQARVIWRLLNMLGMFDVESGGGSPREGIDELRTAHRLVR